MSGHYSSAGMLLHRLGWLFLTISVAGAIAVVWGAVRQYSLLRLPRVPGVMLTCDPVLSHTNAASVSTARTRPLWIISASFAYKVNGVSYLGKDLSNLPPVQIVRTQTFDPNKPPERIRFLCESYKPGTTISIYYSPKNPNKSFVYFSSPLTQWGWTIPVLITASIGWLFFFLARFAPPR